MKKVFRLTESQLNRISKKILNESFMGIISYEDTLCEIICKLKVAKTGSKGDVVKMIQHLLDANGFNVKREGGGMRAGCSKEYPSCDGIFKSHTKDAVMEFQRSIPGLTVDGVVGYNTWKAMCDNLTFTYSLPKDKFCLDCPCDDDFQNDDDFKDIDIFDPIKTIDVIDCEKLKKCVKDYILKPAPDYLGFEKCIGKNQKSDMDQIDWDNLNGKGYVNQCEWFNYKNEYIINCPDYLNCQPGPNKDMRYCNSNAIQSCIANGCTKATY